MNTRALLVLTTTICILLGTAASAAAAVEFRSSTSPETVIGKSTAEQVFTLGSTVVKCGELTHEDEHQIFPTSQLKEKITYALCNTSEGGMKTSAGVLCEEHNFHSNGTVTKKQCKMESSLCDITMPEQGPLEKVTYTNESGAIAVKMALKGITYKATGLCMEASGTNGEYKGEVKDVGEKGAKLEIK